MENPAKISYNITKNINDTAGQIRRAVFDKASAKYLDEIKKLRVELREDEANKDGGFNSAWHGLMTQVEFDLERGYNKLLNNDNR